MGAPAIGICQVYPVKPIRVLVGFPAGGAADMTPRILAPLGCCTATGRHLIRLQHTLGIKRYQYPNPKESAPLSVVGTPRLPLI